MTSEITPSRVASLDYQSTQIVAGQKVGVTITGAKSGHNNIAWSVGDNGALNNTSTPVYYGNGTATIIAYHPFNDDWDENTSYEFSVSTDQSSEESYRNSDLLWATATSSKTGTAVPLTFSHMLAKINVTLTSDDIADLSGATISICGTNINTGFNPSTGTLSDAASVNVRDIKAGVTTASAKTASAIIVPQTIAGNEQFIKVTHNNKTYYYALPVEGKTFVSKHSYSYTLKLKETLVAISTTENMDNWIDEENSGIANEAQALPQIDGEIFQSKITTLANNNITKIIFRTNSTPESTATEISEGIKAVYDNGVITVHINASSAQITSGKDMFSNLNNLQSIEGFSLLETGAMTNMDGMFAECYELTSIDFTNFDTSNVTSMVQVFSTNTKLTSIDLSNFNTSKVTDMSAMFCACICSSLDLSNFDTSNVTTMNQMFIFSAMTSLDLSNFDTSKVENMNSMFNYCENLNSVKMMGDVSNVTTVLDMFDGVKEGGTFYYNEAYDYSKILAELPESWTAIPVRE